jgi:hypothetical protein
MGITPSTLFHFTNKNSLKSILKGYFKLKYCLEIIYQNKKNIEIAIPMVSFCDIKIAQISEHMEKYGKYGIGLSKDWANRNQINPVYYLNKGTIFSNRLIDSIRVISKEERIPYETRLDLVNIIRYAKTYEGNLRRNNTIIENYRFADEREWRFVPHDTKEFSFLLIKDEYDTAEKRRDQNDKLRNQKLTFEPNDILYIILEKDEEIDEFIKHIESLKEIRYLESDISRLMTRILTYERISNDF